MVVRDETPQDTDAVRNIVTRAFERPDEAALVDALRAAGKATLALVAEQDGRVVGHVLFSPVTLDGAPFGWGLAPLAVLPEEQGSGRGSALARAGLERCRASGVATVVVLGDPEYYRRFGFEAADRHGLRCEYDAPPDAFQVIALAPGALAGRTGLVRYAPEFAGF
ncbi:MAG: N-acetyltransferase [Candidatus Binatia bacterium]